MESAIQLMQEALRVDLEQCHAKIEAGEKVEALAALERAFGKLDTALDIVRSFRTAASERAIT